MKNTGFVYAVRNPAYHGLVKIGQTNDIYKRISSLNSGSPKDFEVIFAFELSNYKHVEKLLHTIFAPWRHRSTSKRLTEFFDIKIVDGSRIILNELGAKEIAYDPGITDWVDLGLHPSTECPDRRLFEKALWSFKGNIATICRKKGIALKRSLDGKHFIYPRAIVQSKTGGLTVERFIARLWKSPYESPTS